jgi:radical SAM superfamily enzyme with C-terminal helix-hairpin-helix motif
MVKMKGEVLEKLENAKEITEPIYAGIVETVAGKYIKAGKISKEEINELARELKRHWKTISHSVKGGASRRGAPAKKRRVATKTGRK